MAWRLFMAGLWHILKVGEDHEQEEAELINMDHRELMVKLNAVSRFGEDVIEFQNTLLQALKEQDRNTQNGCAEAVSHDDLWLKYREPCQISDEAHETCMNYRDKDLEEL